MTVIKRQSHPLQWPEGWKRTKSPGTPRFGEKSFAWMRDSIIRQLRMRGSQIVITSDLPTRNDGLPYANARCSDPGVAVYWVEVGHERVIACDSWKTIGLNMRAIDMSLTAMRALDRWGVSEMVDKAFAGFAALPPGSTNGAYASPAPSKRDWWEVLEVEALYTLFVGKSLHGYDLLAISKQRHRDLIAKHHPDRGGDTALAAEINIALEEAERELGG